MVESSILEQDSSKFKLKLRYRGFFRMVETHIGENIVLTHKNGNLSLSLILMAMLNMYEQEKEITIYVSTDKNLGIHNTQKSGQHEGIKEPNGDIAQCDVIKESIGDGDSDHCSSDESYFSHLSSDDDDGDVNEISNYGYSNAKKSPTMEVSSKFPDVVAFRRALNHHVVINDYDYFIENSDLERFTARCTQQECPWRIHASVKQDDITF
nr:transposase, MuDR, MULE transposase domain protein [Tanacetum cinerariifolium]